VLWVPLAADAELHRPPGSAAPAYSADVSFIGGWRPERERLLERLTPFGLKIWGPDWGKRCRGNPAILKAWQGRGVVSAEFAQVVAGSKVNLNLIDPTNYPAANMRYFEIMVAGGLQVCSPCPEMREGFRAGEHLFYYAEEAELPALLERLLGDAELRNRVAKAGRERVMAEHTYGHRAQAILDACGLGRDSRMNGGCGS
jgi:spore maturation protein CgeB